jgi:transcriptional regulator with XRE-family HTH domain
MSKFGEHIKALREAKKEKDKAFSIRKLAERMKISHVFLSQVEAGTHPSLPSEKIILKLAEELGEDPDVLLAMAGRVSESLQEVITKRPKLFGALIRQLKDAPDHAILRVVREVRDGDW